MSECCLIKKVATVEVYENKNEVRAYGFMTGDRNTPVMEVKFRHLWGEKNLSTCKLRWIIVDDVGSLLVGEVPISEDNKALIELPNQLFTGERRMKVQLTVASCDGNRILNLQQFTDLKVINNLATNEIVEPVYNLLINTLYDETQKQLDLLEKSYTEKYGSLDSLYRTCKKGIEDTYAVSKASLEEYMITAENGGNADSVRGYIPSNFNRIERTINELINSASSKYKVGDIVDLQGYYEAGDGAHHKRKIESADDGSGVQLANGLWANIVHNGEVNVSWFGAKGDGVTDDSLFLNKAMSVGNVVVDKNCVLKTTVVVSNKISSNKNIVICVDTPEINTTVFSCESGCSFKDITIRGKTGNVGNIFVKKSLSMAKIEISNANIINTNKPFDLYSVDWLSLKDVNVTSYSESCSFDNPDTLGHYYYLERTYFKANNFQDAFQCVTFNNISDILLVNPVFEFCKRLGEFSNIACLTIQSPYLENFELPLIVKNITGTTIISNPLIHGTKASATPNNYVLDFRNISNNRTILIQGARNVGSGNISLCRKGENYLIITIGEGHNFYKLVESSEGWERLGVNITINSGLNINSGKNQDGLKVDNVSIRENSIKSSSITEGLFINDKEVKNIQMSRINVNGSWRNGIEILTQGDGIIMNDSTGRYLCRMSGGVFTTTKINDLSVFFEIQLLGSEKVVKRMKQEGIYEDFISYMDEQHEYEQLQREVEEQRKLAFENREDKEQSYEDWLSAQPQLMPFEEPQPSQALLDFKKKYLG